MLTSAKEDGYFRPSLGRSHIGHSLHLIGMIAVIVALSVSAVFYALGYELNLEARSIDQTGILLLDGTLPHQDVQITIDGKASALAFPYRYGRVSPGTYDVTIRSAGYQEWHRNVTILENKVSTFPSVLLIRQSPLPLQVQPDDAPYLQYDNRQKDGLEIRSHNEIWLNGTFVTRNSRDISQLYWYVDHKHLVYQAGSSLWLSEGDGLVTEKLADFPSDQAVEFSFKKNGRVLVYEERPGGAIQEKELY